MPKERNCWRKTIYCTICESRNRNCDIIQRYIVRYEHCDAWCLYDWESPDKISYVSRPVKHGQSHSLLSKKILAIQDSSGITWSLWKNNSIAWSQTEVIIAVNHLEKSMLSGGCLFTCAFVPPSIGTTTRSASNMEVERPVGATLG